MSTSFIVNAADLARILENIKIAERHAAGENLVDIVGKSNALLPMGLRTVDGSLNHLLPGQENVGAADQVFPRLLPPSYVNEGDGDVMPLGPPGGPQVTNTNYDPTSTPGTDVFGVNNHSVADADPRIISNLIVDQTLGNQAAVQAALQLAEVPNAFAVSSTIVTAFKALKDATDREVAFEKALAQAQTAKTNLDLALAKLESTRANIEGGLDAAALNEASLARDAANGAKAAALIAVNTLMSAAAPAAVMNAANALLTSATGVADSAANIVVLLGDGPSLQDAFALGDAIELAQTTVENASNYVGSITQAEASAHTDTLNAATSLDTLVTANHLDVSADGSLTIENRSADIGLSPANSGWMTLFGQFFDHGLDLVTKGGNGTVYIPLEADDPLIAGADKVLGTGDDLPAHLRFMTLTRATPFDANGNPSATGTESQNTTTPFVDQNQTYTSSASHQVFLRDYKFSVDSDNNGVNDSFAVNTGRLLNGANGGIANWKEVKAQAAEKLGLKLSDNDVNDVVRLAVDPYGKFEAGANGYAQIIVKVTQTTAGPNPVTTVSEIKVEGHGNGGLDINHLTPADITGAPGYNASLGNLGSFAVQYTGHAFLNDIAHTAAPVMIGGELRPDADTDIGNSVPNDGRGHNTEYDNELLDAHFVTGDGRGNENIGLTAVHTVFHSEHNRLVEANKLTILKTGDLAVINEWLTPGNNLAGLPGANASDADFKAFADSLDWNGERLFQSARFVTEMQYQHLVFEEFARRVQPNVDPFVFTNSADLDPSIIAEFAHTVYRFGHSMLTDTVDRLDNNLKVVGDADASQPGNQQTGLIAAFLNPQMFTASGIDDETATGAIVRGMSRQVSSEIDEFVVEALRDNLLGLPLDLAALNLARGREQGIATLNHAREQIYAMTGAADVKPYTSWVDFAQHLKHPLSVVNFIAAYGTHETITSAGTLEAKRDAALKLVVGGAGAPSDRLAFLNGGSGVNDHGTADTLDDTTVTWSAANSGLNAVDLWIGGLAEEINEFGGQLGSTFNFIFEYQMEHLQNGDRFYYLSRTQGMNLLNLLEPNNFSDIIMRNTDLGDLHATHLPALIMSTPDMILELDKEVKQANYSGNSALDGTDPANRSDLDPTHDDGFLQAIDPKVLRVQGTLRVDDNNDPILDASGKQIYDGGILKFSGGEHVVLGGTEGNDKLIGDKGIDTLWGDGGDDYLNAGMESDQVYGGDGDDIIEDPFGDDFLRGEAGDDVIVADQGLDLLFGGEGQDFIMGVTDAKEVFAGPGDDFILGGTAPDGLMGNEGDDWIEGGEGFDGLSGENSELFFNSPIVGHDILWGQGNDTDYDGENGDDIMVQGAGIQRNNGMEGFDWAIHKGDTEAADSDLSNFLGAGAVTPAFILRDRFDSVEGLSGWDKDDKLTGASKLIVAGGGFQSQLTQAGVDRIDGLDKIIGAAADGANPTGNNAPSTVVLTDTHAAEGGEIILGGAGSDIMTGNLGNDIMDGDAWLNVRISVHQEKVPAGINNHDIAATNPEIATVDSLTSKLKLKTGVASDDLKANETTNVTWVGKSVAELMRSGDLNPGQLKAVREVLNSDSTKVSAKGISNSSTDIDTAVFSDVKANYVVEANGRVILSATDSTIDAADRTAIDAATANGGFITVTHTPPAAGGGGGGGGGRNSDGVDNIRNFEVLHFQDGNIFLKAGLGNNPATGRLGIDITNDVTLPGLNVGDTITANLGTTADQDGLPPLSAFTFSWQFEQTPGAGDWADLGETGRSLTLTSLLGVDGNRLRVIGTFVDQHGILETVFSEPTAPVAAQAVTVATAGADLLVGTNGPDLINALAGDDNVFALAGNDIVIGGAGSDNLDGGLGSDTAVFFGPASQFTFALNILGQLEVTDTVTGDVDVVANFENVAFITGSVTDAQVATLVGGGIVPGATITMQSVASLLAGAFINDPAGNDATLTGTEFDDVIFGNDGDDIIDGLGGSDLLVGGTGDDAIDSGGGILDIVSGGSSTAVGNTIRLRQGNETLLVGVNETGSDTVRNDGGVETISIGAEAQVDVPNQTGTVVALPGAITTLTGVDDGAGNLVLTVNQKTVTITDHFNNPTNAVELINFNGSSHQGVNLGTGNYNLVAAPTGTTTLNGGVGNDVIFGTQNADTLNGGAGNDLLLGGAAADTLSGEGGDDTMTWNAPDDGRDIVDGGLEGSLGDTFAVNGDASDETYRVYARADALAAGITGLAANSEIIVTRNGTNNASVIAELREIEEIVINTGAGDDTVTVIGDFNPTSLHVNTITVNDGGGTDTVDISGLSSGHRIVFNSGAGNDTVVGTLRPQDMVDGVSGVGSAGNGGGNSGGTNGASSFNFTANDVIELRKLVNGIPSANSESQGSTGVRDLEGTGNNIAHPNYGSADQPFIRLTDAHYGAYDPATGNNAINPIFEGLDPRTISNVLGTQEDGLAKNAAGANIFFMAFGQYFDHGLDFLPKGGNGVVEIGGPGSSSASTTDNPADLTRGTVVNGGAVAAGAVPQHLNKTSPFVDQNQAYGSTELVGQFLREGDGHGGIGSKLFSGGTDPSNPEFKLLPTLKELILHHWQNNTVFHHESLPGGEIAFREYYTANGVPLVNASGAINETLARALNANFMGSGHTLIGDSNQFINILEHYVAGDLRANENYTLTSIHTIWARNHNFHVDKLLAAGFAGTAEELFQAAKIVNEVEYQKVVFNEFADYLIGGLKGSGKHGFDDYNPSVDAGISHEFAAAVYRVGHSLIGQNITVIDDNGQQKSVPLFDVFLNPTNDTSAFQLDTGPGGVLTGGAALAGLSQHGYVPKEGYEQIGVNNIIGGIIAQQAEEVDFNLVDAVRDDLVRIRADLFAFNVARGWDVGLGTLNQVRAGLLASTSPYVREAIELSGEDLTPYTSWQDFQTRNGLSNQVLSQFQQAYPDLILDTQDKIDAFVAANPDIQLINGENGAKIVKGIDRVDLWVGGLAEQHINGGMVGTTFWVVLHEQFDRLQEGDRFYYLDRVDGFDFYETLEELKFSDIIARNTGLTNLPSDIFSADASAHGNDDAGSGTGSDDTAGSGDTGTGGNDNSDDTDDSTDDGDGEDTSDDGVLDGGSDDTSGNPDASSTGGNGNASNTVTAVVGNAAVLNGTTGNDAIQVGDANHLVIADSGNDKVFVGDTGANVMAGDGDDHVLGGAGQDNVFGGAGNDQIFGEVGNDNLWGEDGDDLIEAGDGADRVFGGSGSDQIDGGAGNDRIWGGDGADVIHGGTGDDHVEAGNGVDVVWGDAGNDVFVFRSVAEANGDTIADFQPGDRIDLTSFTSGFSLVDGPSFTGAGELIVRAEGDHTIVEGNVSGGTEADFQIIVNGHHVDQLKHGGLGF